MQPFLGRCANSWLSDRNSSSMNGLADECCGMLAHLIAYVGALALLAIIGIHLWDELPAGAAVEPPPERAGAWPCARTRRLPSAGSIGPKNRDLSGPPAPRGWPQGHLSLGGPGWGARRAASGCILSRLILLSAGNEPKLAELFARAELRRGSCVASATSTAPARLGDRCGEPPAARHNLTERASQDAGFHATFSLRAALL
jgi:hypothetical protein